jgi:hypothetical protein
MREAGEGAVLWLLWKPTSERWDKAGTTASHESTAPGHYITASIIPDLNRDAMRAVQHMSGWRCLGCALIVISLRPAREGHWSMAFCRQSPGHCAVKHALPIHDMEIQREEYMPAVRSHAHLPPSHAPRKARPRRGLAAGIPRHISPQPPKPLSHSPRRQAAVKSRQQTRVDIILTV